MEPEKTSPQIENVDKFANLKKVTPLSKYLALALFIILPFLGGYIGYVYAPEKIVEVEQVVANETRTDAFIEPVITNDSETSETENVIFSELSTNLYLDDLDKDVVLDGKTLFWKREFEDEWDMLVVKNSETLEYSGYGIFSDGVQVYSLGYLEGYQVLDPTKKITIIFEQNQHLIKNGEKLYALVSEMSLPILAEVEDIEIDSLEIIGGGYFKDANSVFFMGANVWKLPLANPATFTLYQPDTNDDDLFLGVSDNNVYFKYKLLEGIDFSEMTVKNKSIIRDSDTVWFSSSNNCHSTDFTKGELDKIDTYRPPC